MKNYFELPSALILEWSGRDSERYLNARLTNNVKTLKVASLCLAGALSPTGKTEAYGQLVRLDTERFIFVVDGGAGDVVVPALKRYIVADRVVVNDLSNKWNLLHLLCSDAEAADLLGVPLNFSADLLALSEDLIAYRSKRSSTAGIDLLVSDARCEALERALTSPSFVALSEQEQILKRIEGNRPSFPIEISPDNLFAELNYEESVSFTKGCYVGQEVIEKIDSHGKAAFRIMRCEVAGRITHNAAVPAVLDVSVDNRTREVGEILSLVWDEQQKKTRCFCRVKAAPELRSALTVQGQSVLLVED